MNFRICRKSSVISHESFTLHVLAPVPLSIFRSNSKFDENSERSSFECTRLITTIFCTRHDSDTVVTCAEYHCDRPRIFYTRVFWIFIEFRIRSKYAWWDGRLVPCEGNPPITGGFSSQRASNVESFSWLWCHNVIQILLPDTRWNYRYSFIVQTK